MPRTKLITAKVAELDVNGLVRVTKYSDQTTKTTGWLATNDTGVDLVVGNKVTLLINESDADSVPSIGSRIKS